MKVEKKVVIIDTNVFAQWIIERIMKKVIEELKLPGDYRKVYSERYKESKELIDKIMNLQEEKIEAYIPQFSLLELRSAVVEEIKTLFLFYEGIPVSKWPRAIRGRELIKKIDEKIGIEWLIKELGKELSVLKNKNNKLSIIRDAQPDEVREYFNIYDYLFINLPKISTQDCYLLTTAIINGADYFITNDKELQKLNKELKRIGAKLRVENPKKALSLMLKNV